MPYRKCNTPVTWLYFDTHPDGVYKLRDQGTGFSACITGERNAPGNCEHNIDYTFDNFGTKGTRTAAVYGEHYFFIPPSATYYIVSGYENSLNWKKLSTSNEAGLLQNLAELDDTVAMFGKDLVKSLSYGGYKWGWSPLLSDVAKVNDTIVRCSKQPPGAPQKYDDVNTITKSIDVPYRGGTFTHKWELTTRYKGHVTVDLNILSYYDFLGFHPSPKLVWDLVPLSFAVDWVLPIGDMIDRISPQQGWVKHVSFTGWKMVTATVTETLKGTISGWDTYVHKCKRRTFTRTFGTYHLEQQTVHKDIAVKWPTMSNILDYAYLANSFARPSKRK